MPSRSSDPVGRALRSAAHRIVAAVSATGSDAPRVLIDGRSGAGKSTLSELVEEHWPLSAPAQRVELDWIYPGWDGLAEGAERARRGILEPLHENRGGSWHGWDWERGIDLPEQHPVDRRRGLILEGCGILTPASAPLADVRVWVESPPEERRRRALDRDGDGFRPHWDRWARQEDAHIEQHDPRSLATLIIEVP